MAIGLTKRLCSEDFALSFSKGMSTRADVLQKRNSPIGPTVNTTNTLDRLGSPLHGTYGLSNSARTCAIHTKFLHSSKKPPFYTRIPILSGNLYFSTANRNPEFKYFKNASLKGWNFEEFRWFLVFWGFGRIIGAQRVAVRQRAQPCRDDEESETERRSPSVLGISQGGELGRSHTGGENGGGYKSKRGTCCMEHRLQAQRSHSASPFPLLLPAAVIPVFLLSPGLRCVWCVLWPNCWQFVVQRQRVFPLSLSILEIWLQI